MPFVIARLLAAQRDLLVASEADIVIPHTGEGLEPFHAVYRREACLPHILAALEEGKWRADAWFDQVTLRVFSADEILKFDPGILSFCNINTPEELQTAERLALQLANRPTGT
jgi:molybdopterin-guanine dinucleotide biosynthesis protein A